ncbi:MAG: ribonuclease E/G [Gaiellaceae bacterium]
MIISVDVGEQRVAVIEDDTVVEVYLERRGGRSVAGSIYKGVVDNVLPGMEASFVDIGLERNGFLYVGEIVVPELEQSNKKRGRRIQDLISRGQEVLVQAVKDPMGTKGARLTTEISLPGRFVVFFPYGDGIGISRRLDDDERERLKKLCKGLDLPEGGIIVRTAAEGASQAELEGDLALLRKLWATILGRSSRAEAPTLVYREAELPLRLVRDLFIRDFERLVVDHEQTHRRLVGYLKRTSPELAARVQLDAAAESIMQRHGVDKALRSTLSRTVPLPSGGSLVFDYAEALTVIDVNTGRFVGSKGSKNSLEDTITANNLEAAREVVRQLRLRDIGGIIVIDFIDMANARNRKAVETELAKELGRDRTKTYVVEISPLGLVEMTRQNVTDGPREILTIACPTCEGDGIVLSEESIVIDVERALRSRALASSAEGLLIELNERIAGRVIGPAGDRLAEFEADVGKRVFVESRSDVPLDYFEVLAEGTSAEMEHRGLPVAPGEELELELEDVYMLDDADAIGRRDGYVLVVAGAGGRVGEKVHVVVDRVTRTVAYASLRATAITAESSETLTAEDAIGVDGATGELDDVELPVALHTGSGDQDDSSKAEEAASSDATSEDATDAAASPSKRRRRRRSSRKKTVAASPNGVASDDQSDQATTSDEPSDTAEKPKAKSSSTRRRRRSSSRAKKAPTSADGSGSDEGARPSTDGGGENGKRSAAKGAKKPRPRKKASTAKASVPENAQGDASPGPPANGDAPAKPRRRRRRSTRSKSAAAGAAASGDGATPATDASATNGAPAARGSDSSSGADNTDASTPKQSARRRRSSSRRRRPRSPSGTTASGSSDGDASDGDS